MTKFETKYEVEKEYGRIVYDDGDTVITNYKCSTAYNVWVNTGHGYLLTEKFQHNGQYRGLEATDIAEEYMEEMEYDALQTAHDEFRNMADYWGFSDEMIENLVSFYGDNGEATMTDMLAQELHSKGFEQYADKTHMYSIIRDVAAVYEERNVKS